MRYRLLTWAGVLVLAVACGAQHDGTGSQQTTPAVDTRAGNVSLNLVGTDSTGQQYRLRNANFYLWGQVDFYENISGLGGEGGYYSGRVYTEYFSSEDSVNAARIQRRVLPGDYGLYLRNSDFYLERMTPAGPERVEKLVLLSDRSQSFRVWDGGTTHVAYRFGVDGRIIEFRSGTIDVGIEVERAGESNGWAGAPGGGGAGG